MIHKRIELADKAIPSKKKDNFSFTLEDRRKVYRDDQTRPYRSLHLWVNVTKKDILGL